MTRSRSASSALAADRPPQRSEAQRSGPSPDRGWWTTPTDHLHVPKDSIPSIRFNKPPRVVGDLDRLAEAFALEQLSSNGRFTEEAEAVLSRWHGGAPVILTTSCTHALELAAILVRTAPGDEVIVPSFTFPSTATAFARTGARIRFADIDPLTLNMDPGCVEALLSPRTKAIVPVHYGGVACDMDALLTLADRVGADIVEDNAHGLLGRRAGRLLGTFGRLAALSFHETKNFTMGEGGALVFNDPSLYGRARVVRDKGTNRAAFIEGQVDKYTWIDEGSSYGPSDLLAALLVAQFDHADQLQSARHAVWAAYHSGLGGWARAHGVRQPHVPDGVEHTAHLYYLILPSTKARNALIRHLRVHDVQAVFHYQPLNAAPAAARFGARRGDCPVAEDIAERLVRLPMHSRMNPSDIERVVDVVSSFRP